SKSQAAFSASASYTTTPLTKSTVCSRPCARLRGRSTSLKRRTRFDILFRKGRRFMMRILTIAILLSASTLITVAQDQPNSSADKSMILALESAWNQAEIHHDANAVAAIMSDNFISVDHHGNLQNKSQY